METQHYTPSQVEALGGAELVDVFNRLARAAGVTTTTRFSDLRSGHRRTLALLKQANGEVPIGGAAPVAKPAPAPKGDPVEKAVAEHDGKKKDRKAHKKRGFRFVFPWKTEPKDAKKVKTDSDRGKLLALISRPEGASFEEMLAATWNHPDHIAQEGKKGKRKLTTDGRVKACYEAIRLLHFYCGIGLVEDESTTPKRVKLRPWPPAKR